MSNSIQKHEPSVLDTLYNAKWTRAVVDVVRKMKVPKGCTDEEFFVFMQQCVQSGLNPLLGHAYCVPRRTNIGSKDKPNWVTNHVFQPAIDGMRARAAEFPDFISTNAMAVYANDLITIDGGKGDVSHKMNPIKPGALVGAWGRVERRGAVPTVVWLPVTARSGDSNFWRADAGGMLAKCAEALALRKAYPVAFGGMHVAEEMTAEDVAPSRAEVVLGVAEAPKHEAPALPAAGPVVEFGEWKGRPLVALSVEEKGAALVYGAWQLEQNPKMKQKIRDALTANMDAIRASMAPAGDVVEAELTEQPAPLPITHENAEPPEDMRLPGQEG